MQCYYYLIFMASLCIRRRHFKRMSTGPPEYPEINRRWSFHNFKNITAVVLLKLNLHKKVFFSLRTFINKKVEIWKTYRVYNWYNISDLGLFDFKLFYYQKISGKKICSWKKYLLPKIRLYVPTKILDILSPAALFSIHHQSCREAGFSDRLTASYFFS
jgi:hypothetical protein